MKTQAIKDVKNSSITIAIQVAEKIINNSIDKKKVDKINKELTNGSVILESLDEGDISGDEEVDD